jgi:hypothetical protein
MYNDIKNKSDEEKINYLADLIVKRYGMGTPTLMMLETLKPAAFVGGELGKLFLAPFFFLLDPQSEKRVREYITFLEDRENLEIFLKRIEFLMKQEEEKNKMKKREKGTKNAFDKILDKIKNIF